MCCKFDKQAEINKTLQEKCKSIKQNFNEVEEKWKEETKKGNFMTLLLFLFDSLVTKNFF